MPLGLSLATAPLNSIAQPRVHRVEEGDTLSEIARQYGVSLIMLKQWNDLQDDIIRPGQQLLLAEHPQALGCIALKFGAAVNHALGCHQANREDNLRVATARHIVQQGETMETIASEAGVTADQILFWNLHLDPEEIRPGVPITVQRVKRIVHQVRRGQTAVIIARQYGVEVSEIANWNQGLDPDVIQEGQRLVIHQSQPPSESIGSATQGSLVNGRMLPEHPAYVIRDPQRSYATEATIREIVGAFNEIFQRYPNENRVRIHDLSLPQGGPMDDHTSHQSGRDVDIIYYQRRCPNGICLLQPVLPREMNLGPQWTLLEYWLRRNSAVRIFIDYGLQEVLYNYARLHGVSSLELERWFQYPHGRGASHGVIRHYPNHGDHIHVRFRCSGGHERCE